MGQELSRHITFTKIYYFKDPEVAHFSDIIKVAITLIKATFKNLIKIKRIANYVLKCNFYFHFQMQKSLQISGGKVLLSAELKVLSQFLHFFKRATVPIFIIVRYV